MQEKWGHVICHKEKSQGYAGYLQDSARAPGGVYMCVGRGVGMDVHSGVKEQNQENWVLDLILPLMCCIARRRRSHFPSRPYSYKLRSGLVRIEKWAHLYAQSDRTAGSAVENSEALGEVVGQWGGFLSHIWHRGGGKSGKHTPASLDQDGMTCGVASFFKIPYYKTMDTSLMAQMVKNLPTMQETWVWSLGREDPLEKEMATHSSIFAWRIPWTEEPGRLQSTGSHVGHDSATHIHTLQNYTHGLPWWSSG